MIRRIKAQSEEGMMKKLRTDRTIKGRRTDELRIKEWGKEEKFDDSLKEWMKGWMNERMKEKRMRKDRMEGWKDEWMNERMKKGWEKMVWINEWIKSRILQV